MALPESVKVYSQFVHPLLMWSLLALTLYAGYTGWKWRQLRSASGEEKKAMIQKRFNIKHHQAGSILLALMVLGTIGALAVTYINNGKLFVGPHLIAGLGMAGLIAVSASLVPYMQKGAEWARISHIALNTVLTGLFAWQAVTGIDIVQRIIARMA
jgi:MFS family permease